MSNSLQSMLRANNSEHGSGATSESSKVFSLAEKGLDITVRIANNPRRDSGAPFKSEDGRTNSMEGVEYPDNNTQMGGGDSTTGSSAARPASGTQEDQ
jgi:hypothetical protein